MGTRWCLYGYKVVNDKHTIIYKEAETVKNIFASYISGVTLKNIADELTSAGIEYYKDKNTWNKNMVSRIIENKHYIGDEEYPAIIDENTFLAALSTRNNKGGKREKDSKEVGFIKQSIYCSSCGKRYRRIGKYTNREKWICDSKCKCKVFMDDNHLYSGIISIFNTVISNPELLKFESNKNELYNPSLEVRRQENEIRYMMDQSGLQFQPIKKLILTCASDKFDCCEEDFSNVTEALIEYFSVLDKAETLNYELLSDTVQKIIINTDGSITIRFINNKEINSERGEVKNAACKNSNKD